MSFTQTFLPLIKITSKMFSCFGNYMLAAWNNICIIIVRCIVSQSLINYNESMSNTLLILMDKNDINIIYPISSSTPSYCKPMQSAWMHLHSLIFTLVILYICQFCNLLFCWCRLNKVKEGIKKFNFDPEKVWIH